MRRPGKWICVIGAVAASATAAVAAQRFELPVGPGRDLVYGQCQTCHDLQSVVDSAGIRRGAWDAVLDNMKGFGLRITPDQRERILDYLGTYLGPNPPPADAASTAESAAPVDGAQVYADVCMACHQEGGTGKAGEFPPLAANPDLFLSPEFPAKVVLNGLAGPIEVAGDQLDKEMPAFDFLTDAEIAAVIGHVRSSFGNDALRPDGFADLTPEDVAALRDQPLAPAEVHDLRASLK